VRYSPRTALHLQGELQMGGCLLIYVREMGIQTCSCPRCHPRRRFLIQNASAAALSKQARRHCQLRATK
jgi:hypothetical protein